MNDTRSGTLPPLLVYYVRNENYLNLVSSLSYRVVTLSLYIRTVQVRDGTFRRKSIR